LLVNLVKCGVFKVGREPPCPWWPGVRESKEHLFAKCLFYSSIWYKAFNWLGASMVMPGDLFVLLKSCCFHLSQDIRVKGLLLISHSTLWLIWKARNEFIFSAKSKHFLAMALG
jgi:hypothetical protein